MELVDEQVEIEAEYTLERPSKCPRCGEQINQLNVVRCLRTKVNFTSNLPRRGFAIMCPSCQTILSANLGSRVI